MRHERAAYEPVDDQDFRGAYVSWRLSRACSTRVDQWCRDMDVRSRIAIGDHHCTIMHSPDRALPSVMHGDGPLPRPWHLGGYTVPTAAPRRTDVLGPKDGKGALVLLMDSPVMAARHRWFRDEHLLQHSHDGFVPHVSLSYDFSAQDPRAMLRLVQTPLPFPLHFDCEHADWCDKPDDEKETAADVLTEKLLALPSRPDGAAIEREIRSLSELADATSDSGAIDGYCYALQALMWARDPHGYAPPSNMFGARARAEGERVLAVAHAFLTAK